MSDGAEGRVEAIWLKTSRKGPMEAVESADLVAGVGLHGSADRGGYRQVTMVDAEAWERAMAEIGIKVDPAARRANILLRGIDLAETKDRVLRIGTARIQIRGETLPCEQMEAAADGLRGALEPEWRGGAYGMVLSGGPVALGDTVDWE